MRGQASRFGKQQHKMIRRYTGNSGHGRQANVCASVRADVVHDSGYISLANVRVLCIRLLTSASKRYRENIGPMFRFWSVLPNKWSNKPGRGKRRYDCLAFGRG